MARGRKSKAHKELSGNPGKRPIKAEATGIKGVPDCPAWLDEVAVAEWQRMAALLDEMGVISQTDQAALAAYCATYSRWVRAEQKVQEFGEVYTSPKTNYQQKSAWLQVADKAFDQLVKAMTELGLTPASRHKANVIPKTEASKWDGLIVVEANAQ